MSNARFSIVQARAVKDERITDAQLRVLNALGMYSDKDGWCWPSQSTLAEDIHRSRQTVNGYIAELVDLGYVEKHKRFDNSIRYRLLFDTPLVEPALQGLSSGLDTNVPLNAPINNNTAKEEKPSSLPNIPLSIENQIYIGSKEIVMPDERETQILDTADLIAMGTGINHPVYKGIAYAFMKERGIIIPHSKIKGQRKAVKEMVEQGVSPNHAMEATRRLMQLGYTVVDLFAIVKTAVDIANPAKVNDFTAPQADKFTPMDDLEDE